MSEQLIRYDMNRVQGMRISALADMIAWLLKVTSFYV